MNNKVPYAFRFVECVLVAGLLTGVGATTTAAAPGPCTVDPGLPNPIYVELETSVGAIAIELWPDVAPCTVNNFLAYLDSGRYDGTFIHRTVDSFVIQGGGYTTDLKLKPTRPNISNESGNGLSNLRGTVAMARTGEPHSADSQFFVNLVNNDRLDPMPTRWGYTVFGEIVEGMDVVDDIGYRATGPSGPFAKDVPAAPIIIEKVSLLGSAEDE